MLPDEAMRMTEEEYQEFLARRQPSQEALSGASRQLPQRGSQETSSPRGRAKYGNQRTEVDGLKFDSKHEAEVYQGLMLMVRAGELKAVIRQVGFDLPGGIRYFADFVTVAPDNTITVYDAKSEITRQNRVYINKKKQMAACWGIEIVEV